MPTRYPDIPADTVSGGMNGSSPVAGRKKLVAVQGIEPRTLRI